MITTTDIPHEPRKLAANLLTGLRYISVGEAICRISPFGYAVAHGHGLHLVAGRTTIATKLHPRRLCFTISILWVRIFLRSVFLFSPSKSAALI